MSATGKLLEVLERAARERPDHGLRYLSSGGEVRSETYVELLSHAERLAAGLQGRGVEGGAAVMLLLERSSAFVPAFWACQVLGAAAAPLALPAQRGGSEQAKKVKTVYKLLGQPPLVCPQNRRGELAAVLEVDEAELFCIEQLPRDPAELRPQPGSADDLALVQFSSGSTRQPQGVELSHSNIIANLQQMAARAPLGAEDVELGWMPLFHDMGLVGCHLVPTFVAAQQIKMEASHFLKRPLQWLSSAAEHGATLLTANPTALRHLLRRLRGQPQLELDLSAVTAFMIGAEPVSPDLLRELLAKLAPCGLRAEAIRISYGLAEASLGVSFVGPGRGPRSYFLERESLRNGEPVRELRPSADLGPAEPNEPETAKGFELLDCGSPLDGVELRIVDDDDQPCGERCSGHILIKGPNVSRGYAGDPAATRAAHSGSWLRTGDLGFVDGERLVVSGRVKELLFFAGRNLHAHDVEAVAEEVAGVRAAVASAAPARGEGDELKLLFVAREPSALLETTALLGEVRQRVQRELGFPVDALVPIAYREIPRTSSGKIKRMELGARFGRGVFDDRALSSASPPALEPVRSSDELQALVRRHWAEVLELQPDDVALDADFAALGGTSLRAQELLARLEDACGRWLDQALLIECSTVAEMVAYLETLDSERAGLPRRARAPEVLREPVTEVAVLAASCRFADADDPEAFWDNLVAGRDSVRAMPSVRFGARSLAGLRCRSGSFLDDPYAFDPAFFDLDLEQARVMDPQQRLLLELARECLERGGEGKAGDDGERIGVYIGASQLPYQEVLTEAAQRREAFALLEQSPAFAALSGAQQAELRRAGEEITEAQPLRADALVGNLLNMIAARVSHELDLRGPALALDTACSSSLVAVHQACEALRSGACELALAGGVSLNLSPSLYRYFEAAGALSPSGCSRPFSSQADGFVPGEGAGLVLLKPLQRALEDGDRIVAVIKGAAVNNDGRSIGAMAPRPEGQLEVLREAYSAAGVSAASVGLLECHGTGTRIGDPIELKALRSFFSPGAADPLVIGSVKSNLGHLLGAAGIAGFIKAMLALQGGRLPPSLHASPALPLLRGGGLRLLDAAADWPSARPRRAGISSFGFGGTNCHLVLEQAPERGPHSASVTADSGVAEILAQTPQLLSLSAPSVEHLRQAARDLAERVAQLEDRPELCAGLCQELASRADLSWRASCTVSSPAQAREALLALARGDDGGWWGPERRRGKAKLRVAWLFPGQGAQHPGQALGLLRAWPDLNTRVTELCQRVELERPLYELCWGAAKDPETLRRTDVAQPLLAVFQIALAERLGALGLEPVAVLGHSVGELAAAVVGGALEAEQAVDLAAQRGRLMQACGAGGGMLAIMADAERVQKLLSAYQGRVVVAAYNGPAQTVLAGDVDCLEDLRQQLRSIGLPGLPVPVSHAFHSPQMAPAAEAFAKSVGALPMRRLRLAMLSSVHGRLLAPDELGVDYFAHQITAPVRFALALDALAARGVDVLLELGPGSALGGMAARQLQGDRARPGLALCRGSGPEDAAADWQQALGALGQLWLRGAALRQLPGPALPAWQRPELPPSPRIPQHLRLRPPQETWADPADELLHQRCWSPAPAEQAEPVETGTWLLLGGPKALREALAGRLRSSGSRPVQIETAAAFTRLADDLFALDTTAPEQLRWLFESLDATQLRGVLQLQGLADEAPGAAPGPSMRSLVALCAQLRQSAQSCTLLTVTADASSPEPGAGEPHAAALAAMSLASGGEGLWRRCRVVDLDAALGADLQSAAERLERELGLDDAERVRLSPTERWRIEHLPLPTTAAADAPVFEAGACYLITGGAGGLGLALARHIALRATSPQPHIVLVGRRRREDVEARLDALEADGIRVSYRQLDVSDGAALRALVESLVDAHGRVAGVIHAAGALRVGSLAASDIADLTEVWSPKAQGADKLVAALDGYSPDFVALCSSVAAAAGSLGRGIAVYAAANAYLDALAAQQRRRGLPWTSVALARVRDLGMSRAVAELRGADEGLEAGLVCRAFERALQQQRDRVVVAAPDEVRTWHQVGDSRIGNTSLDDRPLDGTPLDDTPLDDTLADGAPLDNPLADGAPLDETPSSASATVPASAPLDGTGIETFLRRRLSAALSCRPDEIALDEPFERLGLSSLSAVDLLKELELETGRELEVTLLFEHNSLGKVLDYFGAATEAAPVANDAEPSPSAPTAASSTEAQPLLPAQQTFYANQSFYPHLPCYVFTRLDLDGELDAAQLETALAYLCRRHPMLGMVFFWRGAELLQRPMDALVPQLEPVDLSALAKEQQALALERHEEAFRNQVFDLERGPMFKLGLVKLGRDRHSLLFNVHHIVADAWSAQIVIYELLQLHEQLRVGGLPELPALRSDFFSCARAIDASAQSKAGAASLEYWRQRLSRPSPELSLPYDGDPAAEPRGPCRLHQVELDRDDFGRLERLARHWEVTPFDLLLSSYFASLKSWTGESDLTIRAANARREARLPDIERLVGSFADSLPIRVDVSRGLEPRDLARRVRDASLQAQKHPLTSSLQLAGLGGKREHQGPRGITPAGISYPSFPAPERFGELRVRAMRGGAASGFTQLGLIAWPIGGRLQLSWNTCDGLFKPTTTARLAQEHLSQLRELCGRTSAPRSPAARLPSGEVVQRRILDRVDEVPERTALSWLEREISYAELGRATRRLAASLVEGGAGPNRLVGVLARPGAEATVGLLGVLSSGAAYVPLDPEYPDRRLRELGRHAGFATLLTTSDQLHRLRDSVAEGCTQVLLLDEPAPGLLEKVELGSLRVLPWSATEGALLDAPRGHADDLAYVMYTSGTTGRPKGVMVKHAALSLFHDWVHDRFQIRADDRFLQVSALSFGGSLRQIFSPLLAGARLVPAPRGMTRDPVALLEFVEAQRISIWNSVPTLWAGLLGAIEEREASGGQVDLEALRWVLIGGEKIPVPQVRRWKQRFPKQRVVNLYGSTETVVNATSYEVRERPGTDQRHLPIGRARSGSEVHVLDPGGAPCAHDAVGEIFVGGPSLASGYWREPELSGRAFVETPRGRLYRTGDLGRVDETGLLTYLGRADTQVKVRGYRVELSEIEACLEAHAQVKMAAALEHSDERRQWLLGFVELLPGAQVEASELRAHLEQALPAYMIPHRIELMPTLPLSAAGKIDRQTLRQSLVDAVAPAATTEPASTSERLLAEIWCQVLGLDRVGREDDFFELGGDSILALEVLQRLRGKVPVLPRPITLYGERSVAALARAIDALNAKPGPRPEQGGAAAPVAEKPRVASLPNHRGDLPLTPTQESFVLAGRLRPEAPPLWCAQIPLRGLLDEERFRRALEACVERHPMLRTIFISEALQTRQRVLPTIELPLQLEDLRALEGQAQASALDQRFQAASAQRFELDRRPPWSMRLCRVAEQRWEWFVTVHHAIGDGWSVHLLGAELLRCYESGSVEAAGLPALRSSWAQVVDWHQRSSAQPRAEAVDYWRQRFARPWSPLRVGRRGEVEPGAYSGAERRRGGQPPSRQACARRLDSERLQRLRKLAAAHSVPLNQLLLTAWCQILARCGQADDLVLGVATSGRDLPIDDVGRLVGPLTVALPLRVELDGEDLERDLAAVSAAFVEACQHADIPADVMLRAIPRHEGSPYPPGAGAFYSFMDFDALPDLRGETLDIGLARARFHFEAQATGTELMLGVLVEEGLQLRLHGQAPAAVKDRVLDGLMALVQGLIAEANRGVELDAAIVAYLPARKRLEGMLTAQGLPAEALDGVKQSLFGAGEPSLLEIATTPLGRSGAVFVPRFADELAAADSASLTAEIARAVALAEKKGARSVSLAGMLPSWTGYGLQVEQLRRDGELGPAAARLSTGHACTVVAVVKTVQRLLAALDLGLEQISLAVLGFGSIGQAAINLLLDVMPTPREVVVCDREGAERDLAKPFSALSARCRAPIVFVTSASQLPQVLLGADLIVAATSEGMLLDVEQLRPGSLVVDDSFPPICDPIAARARMQQRQDVLLLSGGQLAIEAQQVEADEAVPELLAATLRAKIFGLGMPGCRAESLLLAARPELPPVLGLVGRELARQYWDATESLGLEAAPLHWGEYEISSDLLESVAEIRRSQVRAGSAEPLGKPLRRP